MFGTMKYLNVLRVQIEVEVIGLDRIKHGEPAYPVGGYNPREHPLNNAAKGNLCFARVALLLLALLDFYNKLYAKLSLISAYS